MVTPAIIGWNIVSSSCRPRKYHGALDGFGVWSKLASSSSGALMKIAKTSRKAVMNERGRELGGEQMGPDVDLVDGLGLHVLDRAGPHHGEQSLGVAAGAPCQWGRGQGGHPATTAGASTALPRGVGRRAPLLALLQQ